MLEPSGNAEVHPTACVDTGASLGAGSRIWHFCHVCSGAVLGEGVSLGQNVYVAGGVVIGAGCKVQNNVSLYTGVRLEPDVFCGPSVVFTNVRNPRAAVDRSSQFQSTVVSQGATLGANCTVLCGVRVGRFAFVGAGAVVRQDVPEHALVVGVPARQVGWVSEHGEKLSLPLTGEGECRCPATGVRYRLTNEGVRRDPDG